MISSAATTDTTTPKRSWLDTLRVYLEPPTLRMLLLGFSAVPPQDIRRGVAALAQVIEAQWPAGTRRRKV